MQKLFAQYIKECDRIAAKHNAISTPLNKTRIMNVPLE